MLSAGSESDTETHLKSSMSLLMKTGNISKNYIILLQFKPQIILMSFNLPIPNKKNTEILWGVPYYSIYYSMAEA